MATTTICDYSSTGPAGTVLSNGNTGASLTSIGTSATAVSTATDAAGTSPFAGAYTAPATNVSASSRFTVGTPGLINAWSCIFDPISIPSASATRAFFVLRDASANAIFQLRYTSGNQIRGINSTTGATLFTTTETFALNTRIRVEVLISVDAAAGTYSVNVYNDATGALLTSAAYMGSGQNFGSASVSSVEVGVVSIGNTSSWSCNVSNVRYNPGGTTEIGPLVAPKLTVKWGAAVEPTTAGTTTAIPYPSGLVGGEVLFILGALKTPTAVSSDANWTVISNFADSSGASISLVLLQCNARASGSESGSYTLTHPSTTGGWQMFAVGGVDASTVLDTTVSTYNPGASTAGAAVPALTTVTDHVAILYAATLNSTTVTATHPPVNFTETANHVGGNTTYEFAVRADQSPAGSTGTLTNGWSVGAKNIGLAVAIRPAGTSNVYTVSVADTAAATDGVTRALAAVRANTDAAAALDTVTRSEATARATTDAAPATDALTRSAGSARAVADTAHATDAVTRGALIAARALADTAAALDVVQRTLHSARAAAEVAPATDASSRTVNGSRTINDAVPATDASGYGLRVSRISTDTATATDALTRALRASRNADDAATSTDAAALGIGAARAVGDDAPAIDSVNVNGQTIQHLTVTSADSAPADDSLVRAMRAARVNAEDAPADDALSRVLRASRAHTDAAAASDSPVTWTRYSRISDDNAPATDSATTGETHGAAVSDSAPADDTVSIGSATTTFVNDYAPATDHVTYLSNIYSIPMRFDLTDARVSLAFDTQGLSLQGLAARRLALGFSTDTPDLAFTAHQPDLAFRADAPTLREP